MDTTLGQRVLIERRRMGWNQDDLAQSSGVSRTYISDVERDKISNVGIEVIFALAQALGVSVGYLLGLSDDPLANEQHTLRDATVSYLVDEIVDIYEDLTPEQREHLLYVARQFRDAGTPRIIE